MRLGFSLSAFTSLALPIFFTGSASAQSLGGFGQIVTGPIVSGQVFCDPFTSTACVGYTGSQSISNGRDANQYLLL